MIDALDRRSHDGPDPFGSDRDERVKQMLIDALARGADSQVLAERLIEVERDAGATVVTALRRVTPYMLRDYKAIDREMRRRLRAVWGPAFDAFFAVYVAIEELGSEVQRSYAHTDDSLTEALIGLHARSCLVMREVHHLMAGGFPLGAWARARSMHEAAVVMSLLSHYGREPGTEDLAERFLHHAVMDEAHEIELADAGEPRPSDADDILERRQLMLDRFGKDFWRPYAWADLLFPQKRGAVAFGDLQRLADIGLGGYDYKMASHHVHASARAVELNLMVRGDVWFRVTGPTNVAFADAAVIALVSAVISAIALVDGADPEFSVLHRVGAVVVEKLAFEAAPLFREGQTIVDKREERFQRREARRSAR